MDKTDRTILNNLQKNGRVTYNELSEITKLTIPAVRDRILKMIDKGFIIKFTAILDSKKMERDVTAFITIVTSTSKHFKDITDHIQSTDEILECYSVSGGGTYLIKVRTFSMSTLEALLFDMQGWPGVIRTESNIVLSTFKETTFINAETEAPAI